jgi:hypothetical protein
LAKDDELGMRTIQNAPHPDLVEGWGTPTVLSKFGVALALILSVAKDDKLTMRANYRTDLRPRRQRLADLRNF